MWDIDFCTFFSSFIQKPCQSLFLVVIVCRFSLILHIENIISSINSFTSFPHCRLSIMYGVQTLFCIKLEAIEDFEK